MKAKVTEHKKLRDEIISAQEYAGNIIRSMTESLIVLSPEGNIETVNAATCALLGYEEKEIIGQPVGKIVAEEEEEEEEEEVLFKGSGIEDLIKKGSIRNVEKTYLSKDGTKIPVLFSGSVMRDDDGKIQGIVCLAQDITERKRAEEALQSSEANLRRVITKNADGIIIVDQDGVVRFANPAAGSLFGRKEEELTGEVFGFPIEAGEKTELDIVRKDRETAIAEMRVAETKWEGETTYLASLRDITERKRVEEELRELDRMKSEFISSISHELRTPLHSIKGFTKLILQGKVPDPGIQKEFLTTIDKQSEHLGRLIDSLLDMSRLESGRFQIQKQRLSIKDIIHETVESFYSLASEKDTVIDEDIPATLPEIEADGERVRQVMINLLSNAVKFSNDGSSVTVKGEVNGSELLVQVIDRGIGIPEEAMQHLFERFYRAKDTMARGGAGLGLYISKQIIEAHGGRIWVRSKVGEGSTFSFTLPLGQAGGSRE